LLGCDPIVWVEFQDHPGRLEIRLLDPYFSHPTAPHLIGGKLFKQNTRQFHHQTVGIREQFSPGLHPTAGGKSQSILAGIELPGL
jgi:hypothetical protein